MLVAKHACARGERGFGLMTKLGNNRSVELAAIPPASLSDRAPLGSGGRPVEGSGRQARWSERAADVKLAIAKIGIRLPPALPRVAATFPLPPDRP